MKYLRKYSAMHSLLEQQSNESSVSFKEQLEDFCEMNFAYLLDEGYEFKIDEHPSGAYNPYNGYFYKNGSARYIILFARTDRRQYFNWFEVKDEITQFVERLQNFIKTKDESFKFKDNTFHIRYFPINRLKTKRQQTSEYIQVNIDDLLHGKLVVNKDNVVGNTPNKIERAVEGLENCTYLTIDFFVKL